MNNSNEQNITSLKEITTPVKKELQLFKNELRDSLLEEGRRIRNKDRKNNSRIQNKCGEWGTAGASG